MPKTVAIITARGGSKGIPRKNLALLAGRPLVAHAVEAALGCPHIGGVYVTTDDPAIAMAAKAAGAQVINRPAELATDSSLSSDAVAHALETLRANSGLPEYFVLLQPTSPLRTADHVTRCLDGFFSSGAACGISVCEVEHHPHKTLLMGDEGGLTPLKDVASLQAPRQSLPKCFRQNGAIYVLSAEEFLARRAFFAEPVFAFEMSEDESLDIDSPRDLARAEAILSASGQVGNSRGGFPEAQRCFGKSFDLKSLNRTLDWRLATAADQKAVADRYAPTRMGRLTKCPICKHDRYQPFTTIYDYPFGVCDNCGNVFMLTPPDPDSTTKLYVGEEEDKCIQGAMYLEDTIFARRVEQIARPKAAFVAGLVKARGTWVDVGCGSGELLTAAGELGFTPVGVEADPASLEFARRRGFTVLQGFLPSSECNHVFSGASVVSMINVLEHVIDPVGLLSEIAEHMEIGTAAVFEVPRHPSLSSLSNLLFPDLAYRHIYPPDHLNVFTEKAASIMLDKAGLRPIGVWTFGQDFQDFVSAASLKSGYRENPLLDAVIGATPRIQQAVDEAGLSDALFVVAIKN
ncbi:MAG: cytidylyltransferase domain-containing protein [Thermodesulfobacteriota bacterium]